MVSSFLAKVCFFNNDENTKSFRFEEMSNYYKEINRLTDLMETADIVIRIDSLDNQTFDTFWELANKVQFDFRKYASSCILKVENITVNTHRGYGDSNVKKNFNGYFVCGDYNAINGSSGLYLQEFEDKFAIYEMSKY